MTPGGMGKSWTDEDYLFGISGERIMGENVRLVILWDI